ncbi:MAG: OprO/OprP family phosphate-selective porin [Myxococcota bacterium]|jgi:hypothetical protein|nr:OprO/OprP family phosphate-selective porin [Myxococcota bacterium]
MKPMFLSIYLPCLGVLLCLASSTTSAAERPADNVDLDSGWKDSFRLASADGKFSFTPLGFAQPMFNLHVDPEATPASEGSGFVLRRLAIGFDARFYGRVRAFFIANLARGNLAMWDYFADIALVPDWLIVRAGRFRPWLARHRLVAASMYQLPELSPAMTEVLEIGDGRDLGVGLFGMLFGHLEYGVGVWNGEQSFTLDSPGIIGEEVVPANTDFEVGGRLVYHPLNILSCAEEPDFSASKDPRMAFGAGAMFNRRHGLRLQWDPADDTTVTAYRDQVLKLGAEAGFKMSGFSLAAELFAKRAFLIDEKDAAVQAAFDAEHRGDWALGAYLQGGAFAVQKKLEIAARLDYADEALDRSGLDLYPTAGLSYYIFGYHLRAQLMYRLALRIDSRSEAGQELPPTHDIFFMLQGAI